MRENGHGCVRVAVNGMRESGCECVSLPRNA